MTEELHFCFVEVEQFVGCFEVVWTDFNQMKKQTGALSFNRVVFVAL
jgi:hypothetical protein